VSNGKQDNYKCDLNALHKLVETQMYETQPFCEDYNSRQNEVFGGSVPSVGGEKTKSICMVSRTMIQLMVTVLIRCVNIGYT
jgi:hypothetical protein